MNKLPTGSKERKAIPIYTGFLAYFPDAIAAVAECSRIGNEQHNPNTPMHWDRSKSGDERDALTRHLLESGTMDTDGIRHSTKVAWRALANLQKELEQGRQQIPVQTELDMESTSASSVEAEPDGDSTDESLFFVGGESVPWPEFLSHYGGDRVKLNDATPKEWDTAYMRNR